MQVKSKSVAMVTREKVKETLCATLVVIKKCYGNVVDQFIVEGELVRKVSKL